MKQLSLAVVLVCGACASVPRVPPPALHEATVAELQERMAGGTLTAVALTRAYLDRIEALDRRGPELRSVIATNPDALAVAATLDAERQAGRVRGPLHGIPVLLKDNIESADRMPTTAGSLALARWYAPRDAFLVARLRDAGAVILGKANLSEWANFRSQYSTSGWSAVGGQTRNPYDGARNPCGSSSGSGVAIAANLAAVAIGTETDGSIVCPSAVNGIVGLKPTVGLVSRTGIIPIAASQDTAGPMTRTVADAAALLGPLAAADPADPATQAPGRKAHADYTRFLQRDGLRGARIGVARKLAGFRPEVDRVFEQALAVLRAQGAEVVDPVELPAADQFGEDELEILFYEFKDQLNTYLRGVAPDLPVHSLEELIAFNEREREREMPWFGQDLLLRTQAHGPLTDPAYRKAKARARRLAGRDGIDAALRRHRLDAIVAPTTSAAWTTDPVNGDHYIGGSSSHAAVAGYPNVTVPAGFVHGLPVGISFFAGAWSEPVLLRLAYAYEQASRARRPPVLAGDGAAAAP